MTIQEIQDTLRFIADLWGRACNIDQPLHALESQADGLITALAGLHLSAHLAGDLPLQLAIEALTDEIEGECVERWITGDLVHYPAH